MLGQVLGQHPLLAVVALRLQEILAFFIMLQLLLDWVPALAELAGQLDFVDC